MADTQAPDALTLLKNDHREVEELFSKFDKAKGDGAKQKISQQICEALVVHTRIENEIFYPACEGKVEDADLKEAYVEHDSAIVLMAEITKGGPDDDFYEAKVKVLKEEITHHIKEEEGWFTGIFSQAKRHGLDTDALGVEMAAAKVKYFAEIEKNGLKFKTITLESTKV
ncbi:MAG TPA: hemerythrin domain-containing protein [Sphingomicrobium sp.]|nr:hemerythrin domain-containing protein [Sphingomicrobium sp.]